MGKCAHLHFLLSYTVGLVYWLAGWLAGVGWCWRLSCSRKLMVIIVLGRNANKQEQKKARANWGGGDNGGGRLRCLLLHPSTRQMALNGNGHKSSEEWRESTLPNWTLSSISNL